MQKWEYAVRWIIQEYKKESDYGGKSEEEIERETAEWVSKMAQEEVEEMNEFGKEGWELVAVLNAYGGPLPEYALLYFKRPLNDE